MTFKSTSFKKLSGNKYELYGNLTIRNTTKPVKFDVVYGGTAKDGYGMFMLFLSQTRDGHQIK